MGEFISDVHFSGEQDGAHEGRRLVLSVHGSTGRSIAPGGDKEHIGTRHASGRYQGALFWNSLSSRTQGCCW